MTNSQRKLVIAGNWKMHKTQAEAKELALALVQSLQNEKGLPEIILCPTFTSLKAVVDSVQKSTIKVGAQNMDWRDSGAFTGEIAPPMLVDLGVEYVIIGHSERRQFFGDTNQTVNSKLKAAIKHKLTPILCVGETADERENNLTDPVIARQVAAALADISAADLSTLLVAYEPVWAIGTGKNCQAEEANRVAKLIRLTIANLYNKPELGQAIPVLYGGSVKPANIDEQLAQSDIDGALVGGASLESVDFLDLIRAGQKKLALSPAKA